MLALIPVENKINELIWKKKKTEKKGDFQIYIKSDNT